MFNSLFRTSAVMGSVLAASVAFAVPAQAEVLASGTFEGRSNHVTSGSVSIKETDKGTVVVLGSDFFLDGAPAPRLGFGNDGYIASTQFATLDAFTGEQTYTIPASIDPSDYNEFWVWCEQADVPLGVATLD
ncbi:MAG: DM13 domain-containing protein [Cyanobacteria bacterium P01_F01_bin.150]